METNENGEVITYEEYHPFGTTAYQATNATIKAAAKRYRYTGMERDEETGLSYHNARYYISWLGRWINPDPIGIDDGVNVYAYCENNPVNFMDPDGLQSKEGDPGESDDKPDVTAKNTSSKSYKRWYKNKGGVDFLRAVREEIYKQKVEALNTKQLGDLQYGKDEFGRIAYPTELLEKLAAESEGEAALALHGMFAMEKSGVDQIVGSIFGTH